MSKSKPNESSGVAQRSLAPRVGVALILLVGVAAVLWFMGDRDSRDENRENPAMAAAEMLVYLDPNQELVAKDPVAETVTVRDKTTGAVATVNVNQIRDGKITIEPASPETPVSGAQASEAQGSGAGKERAQSAQMLMPWVPRYPGAEYHQQQRSNIPQGLITIFSVRSTAPADQVLEFYRSHYEQLDYEVSRVDVPGAASTIFAVAPDKLAKMNISLADQDGGGSTGMLRANEAQP